MDSFEYKIGQRWHRKVDSTESVLEILKKDCIYGKVLQSTDSYSMNIGRLARTNEHIPNSSPWTYRDVVYILLKNQDAPKEIQ